MRVWLFNFDAELELSARGSYQTRRHLERVLTVARTPARALLDPGDCSLDGDSPLPPSWHGRPGRAWCPTPGALERLRAAGAEPEPAPPLSALRRANHRRFCLDLGGGAPGSYYANDVEAVARLERDVERAPWLCKRPLGFAGRGQRRLSDKLSPDDQRWLSGALDRGGFVVEPWLCIERELCLHGELSADGRLELGRICEQEVDAHRAWMATRVARASDVERWGGALLEAAQRAASALRAAEYFGPFGIDAYAYAGGGGLRLNPMSEINARYSMGHAVGLGRVDEVCASRPHAPPPGVSQTNG
jgi:hypothetical protein